MKYYNMSSILFNESIINNIYKVTDTIFQYQLKLNKNMYSNRLFLIYDDQKIAQLFQDIKKNNEKLIIIIINMIIFFLC